MNALPNQVVLLLEDDAVLRVLMKEAIELELPAGFEVLGFEALAELKAACLISPPALIVSDLNVLDAGPAEVLDFFQTKLPETLPIIISSGIVDFATPLKQMKRFKIYVKGHPVDVLAQHIHDALSAYYPVEVVPALVVPPNVGLASRLD